MRKLIAFLFLILLASNLFSESPHGKNFKIDCGVCHMPDNWKLKEKNSFNHNKTKFPLVAQHKMISCRQCHKSLVFSQAKTDCASCHKDMHQGTVGNDCNRCHNTQSWIVNNVKQIHQQRGFALVGSHASTDCIFCHKGASQLRFDNLRGDCYSCHKAQYDAAKVVFPGYTKLITHKEIPDQGDRLDCYRCHNMVGRSWTFTGRGFEHGFFPLKGGHVIECTRCHSDGFNPPDNDTGVLTKVSPDCKKCHSFKYQQALEKFPAHNSVYLSHECKECHNTYDWNSVKYSQHDARNFKIYSSTHKGKWSACIDCHNNDATYKANCRKCHSNR